jgi:hypothetical protein
VYDNDVVNQALEQTPASRLSRALVPVFGFIRTPSRLSAVGGIDRRYPGFRSQQPKRSNPACCSYLPRRMSRPEGILVADFSGIALNSWPGCNSLPPPVMSLLSRTKTSST